MLTKGCLNDVEGVHGIATNQRAVNGYGLDLLKESMSGTPRASAMWTCPNAGGLLMMASTAKGLPVTGSGAKVDSQNPSSMAAVIFRLDPTSPFRNVSQAGSRPGSGCQRSLRRSPLTDLLFTMYAINSLGLPPTSKYSRRPSNFRPSLPVLPSSLLLPSSTKSLKSGCVAILTR
jgi:hypothetical protein